MGSPVSLLLALGIWLAPLGCKEPTKLTDCTGDDQASCQFELLRTWVDEPKRLSAGVTSIEDPFQRDLLILRLAEASPSHAHLLCAQATATATASKCKSITGRPHLSAVPPLNDAPRAPVVSRIQEASAMARRGDAEGARDACNALDAGPWRQECHFRVGEDTARAGDLAGALAHCALAGSFARFCLTHAAWSVPHTALPSAADGDLLPQAKALLAHTSKHFAGQGAEIEAEAQSVVAAALGHHAYVGRGVTTSGMDASTGPLGPGLRTGAAIEAVRLAQSGEPSHPERPPVGRYALAILSPHETAIPRTPTFAGGQRLIGADVEEDSAIAALEALFWLATTPGSDFLPHIDDPRPRVRWTAAKLLRLAPFPDIEATLRQVADTHGDPAVVWHALDGLDRKTWLPSPTPHREKRPTTKKVPALTRE